MTSESNKLTSSSYSHPFKRHATHAHTKADHRSHFEVIEWKDIPTNSTDESMWNSLCASLVNWILTNSVIRSYEKERDSLSADMRVMWNVYGWSCAYSGAKGETKSHNIKAEKPQLVNRRMGRERKKFQFQPISTNLLTVSSATDDE